MSEKITRGVVVVADMGYGKSALISHLVCANSNANTPNIYKHIVAFHVCRYDVSSTRTPERFIKRLVGFFATKSAEYGDIISRYSSSSILYSQESCSNELEACFDQGILLPLNKIKNTAGETWIIVLDALDECYEKKFNRNLILELLSSRTRKLPNWVKFLITSRNMSELSKLDRYTFQYLTPSDRRNVADMELFMKGKSSALSEKRFSWTSRILNQSEGIFLYVTTFLELNDTQEHMQDLPRSLEDIYELNFRRQYDDEDYSLSKNILEIISAQIEPISKKDTFDILNKSYHIDSDKFEQALEQLSFFIHVNSVVSFKHQMVLLWLTSKQCGRFAISAPNGHALISNYLMSSIKQNTTFDIVELVIHVAQSEDVTLRSLFVSLNNFENQHRQNGSVLHSVIWKTSSVEALRLLMHHYPVVNAINEDGITPAFVAAAKGHLDQLKYLRSKGENMSFTVPASFNIIATDIYKKIQLMKTVYHSGYSLMHIAAHHGHLSVVEYLIDQKPSLVALKNSVGLTPIDTACENGHLDIVRKLHVVRTKFLGTRCLYYASKFNHIDIVKYIVESKLKMNCISDEHSKRAINSIFRLTVNNANLSIPISIFPNESTNWNRLKPTDSWWVIFKETPLHAAIRSGAIDVAKLILGTLPDTVTCLDGFGFTPALTAVAYNRTELMPMFKNRIEHEKCSAIPQNLIEIKNQYGHTYTDHILCPEAATFAHIVAIYNRLDMIVFVFKERINVSWNDADANGDSPIHYAASRASSAFIYANRMRLHVDLDNSVAKNGSNAFHIAAVTGGCLGMFVLTENLQMKIADVKDVLNRGVMHHIVLRSISYPNDINSQYCSHVIFKYLVEVCGHNIRHRDMFKRNVLHYAFANGYLHIIDYVKTTFSEEYISLIQEEDIQGFTPISYAVVNNKRYPFFIVPKNCSFIDIFYTTCKHDEQLHELMPFWEVVLITHTNELKMPLSFVQRHLVPYLHEIITRAPYLTLSLLVYHRDISDKIWEQQTLKAISLGELPWASVLAIARHRSTILHKCWKPITDSPLHLYMLKIRSHESVFQLERTDVDCFLSQLFSKPYKYSKFGCVDENGYNIFHYSLMSGNVISANVLLQHGIAVTSRRISHTDIFFLCLSSKIQLPFHEHQFLHDWFLAIFIDQFSHTITSKNLCRNNALSIVHLLSMSGMLNTLQKILEKYGLETVTCSNQFGVSTLYLAELFGEIETVKMLRKYMNLTFPDGAIEEYLLLNMLHNFPLQNISETISKLLRTHHDGVKNHLRHFYRVYTFVKGLDKLSLLRLTMHKEQLLLNSFPFLLTSVSHLGALQGNKNRHVNCTIMRDQVALVMETVGIYHQTSGITMFPTLFQDILPNKNVLRKVIQTASNLLKYKPLAEAPVNNRTCSELNEIKRYLYHNVILLAGQITDLLQNYAVHHYFKYLKNKHWSLLPGKYDFIRSRKDAFQFPINPFEMKPLIEPIDILVSNYRYIDVIKGTWAYRQMRANMFDTMFGLLPFVNISTKVYNDELIQMTDPLLRFRMP